MKAKLPMILAIIVLLTCGTEVVYGQQEEDPAKEKDKVETGIHLGQRAPDIVLESPSGEKISLSSLRGKGVLIDFWAAWCGPCRRQNPHLRKIYHHYKNKEFVNGSGFTIISVSFDRNRDDWIAAIEQDSLDWEYQVIDLKGMQSGTAVQWELNTIPANTIVDGNGIVVSVGWRGSYLEEKLEELLK